MRQFRHCFPPTTSNALAILLYFAVTELLHTKELLHTFYNLFFSLSLMTKRRTITTIE